MSSAIVVDSGTVSLAAVSTSSVVTSRDAENAAYIADTSASSTSAQLHPSVAFAMAATSQALGSRRRLRA